MPLNSFMAGSLTSAVLASAIAPMPTSTSVTTDFFALNASLPLATTATAGPPPILTTEMVSSFVGGEPSWISHLTGNARRVGSLKAGWDGAGSIAISPKALFLATSNTRFALKDFPDVSAPHLVPGGDGSLQVEWHARHGELELDIGSNGQMSIWIKDHRNGAEFDAQNEAALALFYRWAPWIASARRDDFDAPSSAQMPTIAVAA